MFDVEQYELVDFGDGRKLERFGDYLLDRPCPAAEHTNVESLQHWPLASARFERQDGQSDGDEGGWSPPDGVVRPWVIHHGEIRFQLKTTQFGHLGLFPEQAVNWTEIERRVAAADRPLKVLNLFAYTGGSTMASVLGGAGEVVHVDAARNVLAWAKQNAQLSGMSDAPIRWIHEDAQKFAERELKRGNQYDAIILDPPSYGHGPKGNVWKFSRDIAPLLRTCHELTKDRRAFVLLTCHTYGFGAAEIASMTTDIFFGSCAQPVSVKRMRLQTAAGRRLVAGLSAMIV